MSNAEILQRVIKKAQASGWLSHFEIDAKEFDYKKVYFSHDFAKVFWGEKRYEHVGCGGVLDVLKEIKCPKCGHVEPPLKGYDGWQFHLQQMVISDDPLKYLEKFLDNK
jgi:hypothetical protein